MATEKLVIALIRASRPSFRNNHDKVAFAVHASFLAAGYVLTATGSPAFTESALSSTSTDEVGIEQWNEFDDGYAFVYFNPEKGNKKVLVKCLVLGDKLLVDALSNGGPEPVHLEVSTDDYIGEDGATNYGAQYKNLGKLLSSLDSHVLSKLDRPAPAAGSSRNDATRLLCSSRSSRDSDRPAVMVTEPEDIPQFSGVVHPPINPLGGGDLYPGPGAGVYPTRGDFGGGSMLVGPDDPRWFGGGIGGDQPGFPGGFGGGIRGDQPGFPGRPGVPPGARFDPHGPPGVPGFEPNRFTRFPRRPGGGTHPDLEQPGRDDFI